MSKHTISRTLPISLDLNKIVLIVLISLLVACQSGRTMRHQNNAGPNQKPQEELRPEAKEYFREKTDSHWIQADRTYLKISREEMGMFAESSIRLGAGFKYRIRPSKTPHWRYLAIGGSGVQYIVDRTKNQMVKKLSNAGGGDADWHPGKPWLVGMGSGILRITDVKKETVITKWKPKVKKRNINQVRDIRFMPDGNRVIFTYLTHDHKQNGKVEVWNVGKKQKPVHLETFTRHHNEPFGFNIVFPPGENHFTYNQRPVERSGFYSFTIWRTDDLKPVFKYRTAENNYVWLRFQKLFNNTYIFSRGDQSALEIFEWPPENEHETARWVRKDIGRPGIRDYDTTKLKQGNIIELESRWGRVSFFLLTIDRDEGIKSRTKFASVVPGNRIGHVIFGPRGERIYLATGNGDLWIYRVRKLLETYRKFTNMTGYYRWKAKQKFGEKQKKDDE